MTFDDKKPQAENLPAEDDRIYDLLVDGELDNDRRRTLLSSLDDKPGGWRRCALAFLEAQSWGQEFRSLSARLGVSSKETESVDVSGPKSIPGKKSSGSPKRIRKMGRSGTILGMAASFLLAMGITSLVRDMNPNMGIMPGDATIGNVVPPTTGKIFKPAPPVTESRIGPLGLKNEADKALHVLSLTGQGTDGKVHAFGLPAISQDHLNQQWLKEMPTAIPDGVVQSFQKAGHDVKTTRQLIPFQMKDGRKLIIPVDQVDVRYATTPYYQ